MQPRRYYRLNSGAREDVSTNLQLFMLRKGMDFWVEAQEMAQMYGAAPVPDQTERFVATIILWGASVSQLLGQNSPPAKSRIGGPRELWTGYTTGRVDEVDHPQRIVDFFTAYDRCRHFGESDGNWSHDAISAIDMNVMHLHFAAVREIWRFVASDILDDEGVAALLYQEFDNPH